VTTITGEFNPKEERKKLQRILEDINKILLKEKLGMFQVFDILDSIYISGLKALKERGFSKDEIEILIAKRQQDIRHELGFKKK